MEKDSPTKNMNFDVCGIDKEVDILKKFPTLNSVKEFHNYDSNAIGLEKNKVIRYIVIMYSEDSFLNKRPAPEIDERKRKAATLAGFKKQNNGDFDTLVIENLFMLMNGKILDMIIGFLKIQSKYLWTEIITTEQLWWENIRLLNEGSTDLKTASAKTKVRADIQSLRKDLEDLYDKFYRDHEDVAEEAGKVKTRTTLESLVPW